MIDLTEIIMAILTFLFSLITAYLIPYLITKHGAEKYKTIKFWVKIAVEAAEMIYKEADKGGEKKAYVIEFLKSKGFTLDTTEIENMIEAAVLELQTEKQQK